MSDEKIIISSGVISGSKRFINSNEINIVFRSRKLSSGNFGRGLFATVKGKNVSKSKVQ